MGGCIADHMAVTWAQTVVVILYGNIHSTTVFPLSNVFLLALPCKDIVFRFIIEYSSLRDFRH